MNGAPIVLKFYNPETSDEEKTFTRSFIPWKLMKQAAKLMKAGVDFDNLDEKSIDEINGLIVDIFGGQFTAQELEEHAEISEVVTALKTIVTKISGMMPEVNPTKQA